MTPNEIFNRFQRFLRSSEGDVRVLEQRIPIETQMEYFKYSDNLRRHELSSDKMDFNLIHADLYSPFTSLDEKKHSLSLLALSKQVKSFRLLEQFVQRADPELSDWAYLALNESRITLESDLSDEKQIYISTGLGGRGNKLRFFLLLLSAEGKPLLEYQRQTIEKEFAFSLPQYDCELERLTIRERYIEIVFLAPIQRDIKTVIDSVMTECNQYGDFLAKAYTVTNVKELSEDEIAEIIKEYENTQTSR